MNIFDSKRLHSRIIESESLDKGKRHYWGHRNGDYGFYQSTDLIQMNKLRQQRNKQLRIRQYASLNKYKGIQQPQNQQNYEKRYDQSALKAMRNTKKKSLLKISDSFQIQLPPVNRSHTQPIQNTSSQKIIYEDYHNICLNKYNRLNQIKNMNQDSRVQEKPRAVRTEASEQYFDYNNKSYRVRYTPTFVCSLANPLPSYKLYPYSQRKY